VKLKLAIAALFVTTSALAQTPAPEKAPLLTTPQKFNIELDAADLSALSQALIELPKRVADPLIAKINAQLQAQEPKPAEAPKSDKSATPQKEKAK